MINTQLREEAAKNGIYSRYAPWFKESRPYEWLFPSIGNGIEDGTEFRISFVCELSSLCSFHYLLPPSPTSYSSHTY